MAERKGPEKSATLFKVGIKKTGNDGNTWIIEENKNGVKRWVLFKKLTKKVEKKGPSNFNSFDFSVYDKIKEYKSIYEMIMNKSLDYKIDLQESNIATPGHTSVNYHKIGADVTKISKEKNHKATMFVVGYLVGNTFHWYEGARLYYLKHAFETSFETMIKNKKVIESFKKLFSSHSINLPEKYNQIIIYLLSLFGAPHISNFIRFSGPDNLFFINITMPLDMPYWEKSTQHIIDDFNDMKGGSNIKGDLALVRILKDNTKGHKSELKKLIFL
jgi:hypothetical protein